VPFTKSKSSSRKLFDSTVGVAQNMYPKPIWWSQIKENTVVLVWNLEPKSCILQHCQIQHCRK
jgi:hypothetical protein